MKLPKRKSAFVSNLILINILTICAIVFSSTLLAVMAVVFLIILPICSKEK